MATLHVVYGPTASGKTTYSIKLAQELNCPVVSADARQFYREMEIGTAKPTPSERKQARHHFIDFLSIHDVYTVADYEADVIPFLEKLFQQHQHVILAGGSGLFIKAVTEGLDPIPNVPQTVREELNRELEIGGLAPLLDELQEKDPVYFQEVDRKNSRRITRALEVCRVTGKPFTSYRTKSRAERPFTIQYHIINLPREVLYERINRRCDEMVAAGLPAEVKSLYPYRHLPALQTIGYREFFPWVAGDITLEKALEECKRATRNYAKRQITWGKQLGDR